MIGSNTTLQAQGSISDEYRIKAEALASQGERYYDRALQYYQKSYDLVVRYDVYRAANLCNDMSSIWLMKSSPQRAVNYCQRGLSLLKSHPQAPDSLRFKLYSSLGILHKEQKILDSSAYYFQKAQILLDQTPATATQIPDYVIHHYNNYGQFWLGQYRYRQALTNLQKAYQLIKQYHREGELPYIESSLAHCYGLMQDYSASLRYRLQAYVHTPEGFPKLKRSACSSVGYAYQQKGRLDSALFWYQKASLIPVPANNDNQLANIEYATASCLRQLGRIADAKNRLQKASQSLDKEQPDYQWLASNIAIESAAVSISEQRYVQARKWLKTAQEILGVSEARPQTWPTQGSLSRTLLLAFQWEATTWAKQYQQSQSNDDLQKAFEAFDKALLFQNRVFLTPSEERNERYTLAPYRQSLFEEAWPMAYTFYQQKPSSALLERIFGWFEVAQSEYLYRTLHQQAAKPLPESSQVLPTSLKTKSTPQLLSSTQIRQKLPASTAYIAYQWQGGMMYAFVITNTEVRFRRWEVNEEALKRSLENIKNELNVNPYVGEYRATPAAITCYRQLIEPVWTFLKGQRHWVFGRDGQMHDVPFEVFETGQRKEDYLLKYAAISYVFSASSVWGHPFADKPFSTKKELVIAPFVEESNRRRKSGKKPVESLRNLQGEATEVIWGEQATKTNVLKTRFDRPLLYIATHAESNEQTPDQSFLEFYTTQDNRLYLDELAHLSLAQTHLTVLGACYAGTGKKVWGEGSVSLAKAVIEAGCPSVVSSVWEANEKSMSLLIAELRQELRRGLPIDIALQNIKLKALESKRWGDFKHPYYWANLTLIGQSSPIYADHTWWSHWPWMLLGLIMILGMVWIWKNRIFQ
ncbi:MAG: CHAT domain-containing protein [Runella sp.]